MADEQILLTKKFNPSKVKLGDPKGNYINVFYPLNSQDNEFTKLKLQTPKMRIPWDLQERKSRQNKLFAINVTVSTDEVGSDKNKKNINMFREKIVELENKIKDILPPNFKSKEFSSSLYQGKNFDYKPTMRLSIPCYKDEIPSVSVFDKNGDSDKIESIVPKSVCTFIICLNSVWSTQTKVGINWNIEQVTVYGDISRKRLIFQEEEED